MGDDPPSSAYIFLAVGALLFEISFAKGYLKKVGKFKIAGSLNKLNKKGSTFSILSGPPRLNKITRFFHLIVFYHFNQIINHIRICFREHTMT